MKLKIGVIFGGKSLEHELSIITALQAMENIDTDKYEVIPIYSNRNFLKIKLDCIISVHLTQYIYKIVSNKIKNLGENNLNKKVEV